MNSNKVLLILLIIVAAVMIYLGVKGNMKPPIFTGIGFVIIAFLFNKSSK
ncbi:hypothetical protein RXV94_00975 [Yeosuana sp. MJ-SS3]|jgi:Na+-transporting methylmalonyl-CoA/oxaloacetate decarboxylase beta subunit|uniref:Uncharacterized protein n=1 Tax=Gilvirhabdus luticola TaxID=3079858 RepID=A0ABU3U300_9FLAO|nr:hypothetical protein [Yeosuana sp. MJ-SS3]MDU8884712.1 hypothetical protein [Yeosuana sp. MJ-SS3]